MGVGARRAGPRDDGPLREIAFASKGRWGYEVARPRSRADGPDLSRDVRVAEEHGAVVAWPAPLPSEHGACELDDLRGDPPATGCGIGRLLVRFAPEQARQPGASALRWEREPNAVGFCERTGAPAIGATTSSWGGPLPVGELPR